MMMTILEVTIVWQKFWISSSVDENENQKPNKNKNNPSLRTQEKIYKKTKQIYRNEKET